MISELSDSGMVQEWNYGNWPFIYLKEDGIFHAKPFYLYAPHLIRSGETPSYRPCKSVCVGVRVRVCVCGKMDFR